MLKVIEVRRSFGDKEVLRGSSFELKPACIAGLIGPSGGGKSVLLKIIAGVGRRDGGTVLFNGRELGRAAGEENDWISCETRACSVSLMFQEGALFDSLTVLDNVAFPLVQGAVPTVILPRAKREEVHAKVETVLARVGLTRAALKFPAQLSGGMRRRVSLARALVSRPELVLLDDPTSGLDPVASSVIMDLISELHREYLPTTIMVSHDLRRLLPVVDTILCLFDGRIVFSGTLHELRECDNPSIHHFVKCRFDLGEVPGPPVDHQPSL